MKRTWLAGLLVFAGCWSDSGELTDPPPIVNDDQVVIDEDSHYAVTKLLENDENVRDLRDGDIVEPPQHGTISPAYSGGPLGQYVPNPGYHGPDRFTYVGRNYDGESPSAATVTIDVVSDGIPYEQATKIATGAGYDVALGDLTGDGRLDAVVAQLDTVLALVNTTAGPQAFSAVPLRYEGGHEPWSVDLGDLDRDGLSDIVVASRNDGVVVLRNRGASSLEFDAPVSLASGDARDVVLVDLDRDGRPDLASVDYANNAVVVRMNASTPGSLAFGIGYVFSAPVKPDTIAVGDADRAGGPDLIVTSYTSDSLSLFVNAMTVGDTVPAFAARIDRATGDGPSSVLLADLDADQRTEIVVADASQLWVYANRSTTGGANNFIAARVLDLPSGGRHIAALDLDGLGALDLVVGSSYSGPYSLLFNQSTPGSLFAFDAHTADIAIAGTSARASLATSAITSGDFDGTGRTEIIVTGSSGTFVIFE